MVLMNLNSEYVLGGVVVDVTDDGVGVVEYLIGHLDVDGLVIE